jgi:magnesium transporter
VRIEAIKIEGDQPARMSGLSPEDVVALVESKHFTWVDIQITDDSDAALGQLLAERLDFHPATVADCFHDAGFHQPKLDEEQDYRFFTFIYYELLSKGKLHPREIHAYVSDTYVITLHRHSCEELLVTIRQFPRVITDYEQRAVLFLHHIMDMVADSFAQLLSLINLRSDELEIAVLNVKQPKRIGLFTIRRSSDQMADMRGILRLRRSLVRLRRTLILEEEIVDQLVDEYNFEGAPEASEEIAIYFRDISDHIGKYLENIEAMESTMNHLMEVHNLLTTHRTNEIIYILTIVASIVLPLNLIVGFWGMNFDSLWLIHNPFGIWGATLFMLTVIAGMYLFFRYKEWI